MPDDMKTPPDPSGQTVKPSRKVRGTGPGAPVRSDGRRMVLTYMEEDLLLQLKTAALVHDTNMYEIIEEAVRLWLAEQRSPARE